MAMGSLPGLFDREGPIPAVLRVPTELWLQIFDADEGFELKDLINWRSTSKALWHAAPRLMALLAARQLPQRAKDPFIDDGFYSEALLAAHYINVKSPFAILLPRSSAADGSEAEQPTSSSTSAGGPSSSATSKGKTKASSTVPGHGQLPRREDWIIGSRRTLHEAHVKGSEWVFGACSSCKHGICKKCHHLKRGLDPLRSGKGKYNDYTNWNIVPSDKQLSPFFSNAIFAADALFCRDCIRGKPATKTPTEAMMYGIPLDRLKKSGLGTVKLSKASTGGGGSFWGGFGGLTGIAEVDRDIMAEWGEEDFKSCFKCGKPGHYANKCPQRVAADAKATYYTAYWAVQLDCLKREIAIQDQLADADKAIRRWKKKQAREAAEQESKANSALPAAEDDEVTFVGLGKEEDKTAATAKRQQPVDSADQAVKKAKTTAAATKGEASASRAGSSSRADRAAQRTAREV